LLTVLYAHRLQQFNCPEIFKVPLEKLSFGLLSRNCTSSDIVDIQLHTEGIYSKLLLGAF